MHITPNGKRFSNDLDYFHDSVERVEKAFRRDHESLMQHGYSLSVTLRYPGFVRAIVSNQDGATKVEWAHDSAWRFLPAIENPDCGYQLHPIDLAVNKVLALVGRNEPRDLLDTVHVDQTQLGLGALCWAAAGKDPGYTPTMLLELLRRRGCIRPEDLERLHLAAPIYLPDLKRQWLGALNAAENFIASRTGDEIGCLFFSVTKGQFVQPTVDTQDEIIPHFGRPGGVVPNIRPIDDP